LNEAEAADACACAFIGIDRGKRHSINCDKSTKSFRRAIEIDANNSMSYVYFASYLLMPLDQVEEAVRQLQIAERADPLSPQVHGLMTYVLLSLRRYDEAARHCEKASNTTGCMGRVRLAQGRIDEAIQFFSASASPLDRAYLGNALARAGRREEAEKLLASTLERNPFQQALIYAGFGDKDRTFEALNRVAALGPVRLGRTLTYPEFALVRGDPRSKALRKKAGLPE
jgi:tetratricopeptide (TPR) repeat protein